MDPRLPGLRLFSLLLALTLGASAVRADAPLVTLEAAGAMPLTAPQSDRFGLGASGAVGAYYGLAPWVLVGAKLRAGFLSDGDAPSDRGLVDPGVGTLETATLMLRLRPSTEENAPRAHGLFVEAGPAGALTGELVRAGFEAAIGYGIPVGSLSLAPTLRYVQVIQPSEVLSSEDARLLMLGLELAVVDAERRVARVAVVAPPEAPQAPADLDEDGVVDAADKCKDTPEDRDGYQDDDGCPDLDDDADQIPDASDKCPQKAEDMDAFEDADGCPDPDNDEDTFLDPDDQCPGEAEVINGNEDYDGCPDEGLIEMRNDRIVLEERVLFDFERARIKTAARPILTAIGKLFELHPEWVKIRIEGHADTRGDAQYNLELSQRRADNVRKEIVKHGIPEGVIDAVGFGSEKPRDLREEEDAHHRNRRVEFVVVARAPSAMQGAAPGPSAPVETPRAPAAAPSAPVPAPSAPLPSAPAPATGDKQ
jgi:outer membrane protein OmpA-like peptidoglycan-associated protein